MAGVSEGHDVPGPDSLLGLMSALGLDQSPGAAGFYRRGEGLDTDYLAKKSISSLDFIVALCSMCCQTLQVFI